jgi:ferredoxin-NADP reductase
MSTASPASPAAPRPRQRLRDFDVTITEVVWETPDTVTLVYDAGAEPMDYMAGQFVTIRPQQFDALKGTAAFFEELKGKREPARAYSMASAPHEPLAITIKEELYVSGQTKYPPLLSPVLVWGVVPGMKMRVNGFGGPYHLPADVETKTDHIVHICAGSGIVPNWSIIKDALHRRLNLRHTLVYGNKTWNDVIFRDALAALAARVPDRLRIVHALSREDPAAAIASGGGDVRRGRVSRDLIADACPDLREALVYSCGPAIGPFERKAAREKSEEPTPRFLESVLEALAELGLPKEREHHESYG